MIFPRTRFVDELTINQQMPHVHSEVSEVLQEFMAPTVDYQKVAVELFDVIHACETALRILEEKEGIDIDDAECHVTAKNRARGYYEEK